MSDKLQSEGRAQNAAQPLGERSGLVSDKKTKQIGEHEKKTAGPDGGDATEITENRSFRGPDSDPAEGKRR